MLENKKEVNWRLFWNTRKELVLGLLFFVLSALILLIGIIRQISPLTASLDDLKASELELAKFYDKSEQLKQLAIDPNFNQASGIEKVLPSHKPLLEVLNNLNKVANTTEVVIKNFSLNPGEIATDSTQIRRSSSAANFDFLDLDFSVSGPLWRIQEFMRLIEQVTPISTITSISISRNIEQDVNAVAQADLVLRSFYFTQAIRTTITNPLPDITLAERRMLDNINQLIPGDLELQEQVIRGDRGNLFGIQDQSIEELEQSLILPEENAGESSEE
jgi:hypothetical protein